MIKIVSLNEIKCFYGEERLEILDKELVTNLASIRAYLNEPILIGIDNCIIDGHHRYLAARQNKEKVIPCIILNVKFEESIIYRNFDRYCKNIQRDLHKEFQKVLTWIIQHLKT